MAFNLFKYNNESEEERRLKRLKTALDKANSRHSSKIVRNEPRNIDEKSFIQQKIKKNKEEYVQKQDSQSTGNIFKDCKFRIAKSQILEDKDESKITQIHDIPIENNSGDNFQDESFQSSAKILIDDTNGDEPEVIYKDEGSNNNIKKTKKQFNLPSFSSLKKYIPKPNLSNFPVRDTLIYSSIGALLLFNIYQSKQITTLQNELTKPQTTQTQLNSNQVESLEKNLSKLIDNLDYKIVESISTLESRLDKQNHFLDRQSTVNYNETLIQYPILIGDKNETLTYNTKTNEISLFNKSLSLNEAFTKIVATYHKEGTSPNNMNIKTLFELAVDSYFAENINKTELKNYFNQLKSTFKPNNDTGYTMLLTLEKDFKEIVE
jgi:hypothetical protein